MSFVAVISPGARPGYQPKARVFFMSEAAEARSVVDPRGIPTVLVVEDNRLVRAQLGRHFTEAGWRVVEASNGFSGLRLATQDAPDVVVLDAALPDLPGCDLLNGLRREANTRDVPVLAVRFVSPELARPEQCPADAIVPNPYDVATVVARAADLVCDRRGSEGLKGASDRGYERETWHR